MSRKVTVVVFEHNSTSDENVVEVYGDPAVALRRTAEIAAHNTEEEAVEAAFSQGDYAACVDLFVQECENGADHRLNSYECEVKDRTPRQNA